MSSPIRLTMVLTHPVQYVAPWLRFMHERCPELYLTVLYGALPDADQQGVGFGRAFRWDTPLTDGYRFVVCGGAAAKSFDSDSFRGVDVPDIERHIAATRPDVLLAAGWHSILQVRALRAARRLGVPVLYRGDSTLFSGPRGLLRTAWQLKTHRMLRRFDGYLAVGTHAEDYLRAFGMPEPLVVRSPHCVDNDRFHAAALRMRHDGTRERERSAAGASDDDLVVLFAGKLVDRKRPLDAVRAVARLGPGAVLMMAGDGLLADATRAEARRLGVRLAWRGFLNQTELPSAFAAADCLIVPSAWESWGLIVNEALASGLPCVVTTRVACAPDLIVDGITGFAVEPGDVDALARRLDDVRAAHRAGHDFALPCCERVEACRFHDASRGVVEACRRVLARRIPSQHRPSRRTSSRHVPSPHLSAADATVRVVACCGGMVQIFGVERVNFALLDVLRQRGAAIHCIVNSWNSSRIVKLATELGASWSPGHYRAPVRRRGLTPAAAARIAWDVLRVSGVLWSDARRFGATHVLAPDFVAVLRNAPALAALRFTGVRVVLNVQNAPEPPVFYQRLWKWAVAPLVDELVANSRFTAGALRDAGIPPRKIRTIYNAPPPRGSDASAAQAGTCSDAAASPDERRIVFVGQVIPAKGPDLLLEALGLLVERGVDARLDVVGDMDGWEPPEWRGFHRSLRERASRPDLAGRVRFLGMREDVPSLLAAASVHCAPSRPDNREAFGIVVAEAKHAGVPSVVLASGALPELVEHRVNGWVCAEPTPASLADGLEYFLSDPYRRQAAGAAARASAVRFGCDAFARAWLDVFGIAARAPGILSTADVHAG